MGYQSFSRLSNRGPDGILKEKADKQGNGRQKKIKSRVRSFDGEI